MWAVLLLYCFENDSELAKSVMIFAECFLHDLTGLVGSQLVVVERLLDVLYRRCSSPNRSEEGDLSKD